MTIFVPSFAPNTKTLGQYVTDVRRLLHDSTGKYWSDPELIDYINEARNQVVADTGCNRILQTGTLVIGQEAYALSFCGQTDTFDVLNIRIKWGTMWYQLDYKAFGQLSTLMRAWSTWQQRPVAFSVYGNSSVYIAPVPDQNYPVEMDTVVAPGMLVNTTDQDFISFPYVGLVKFYAAYLAKFKEQSYDEANAFKKEYYERLAAALRSSFTRRIPSMYS